MYIFLKKNLKILIIILSISIGLLYSINSVSAAYWCHGYWLDPNNSGETDASNLTTASFNDCNFDCETYSTYNCYTPPPNDQYNSECVGDNGDYDTFGPDGNGSDGFGDVVHTCRILNVNGFNKCSNIFDNIDRNVNQHGQTIGSYCFAPNAFGSCWWMEGSNVLKRRWCSDNESNGSYSAAINYPDLTFNQNYCHYSQANNIDADIIITADGWTAMEIPGIEVNGNNVEIKGGFCADICVNYGTYIRDYELCSNNRYFSENDWNLNSCPYTQYNSSGNSCVEGIVYNGADVCDDVEPQLGFNINNLLNKSIYGGGTIEGVDITDGGSQVENCTDTYGDFFSPSCDLNCGSLLAGYDICHDAGGGNCDANGSDCADYGGVGDLDEYNVENWKDECELFEDIDPSYWDGKVEHIKSGVFGKEFGEYGLDDYGGTGSMFGPVQSYDAYNPLGTNDHLGAFNNIIEYVYFYLYDTVYTEIVVFDGENPSEETCGDDQNEFVISNGSITRCCDHSDDVLVEINSEYYCIDADKVDGCGNYQINNSEECDAVYGVDLIITSDGYTAETTRKLVGNDSNCSADSYCLSDCTCFSEEEPTYCGDGEVQEPNDDDVYEQCEYPGDQDDALCSQSTSECNGNKLGIRDEYGDCDADCACVEDEFVYSCVSGQCEAECSLDADCDDDYCSETYYDYCINGVLYDYGGDGILNYTIVSDSIANTCDDSGNCQCTDNSDQLDCSAPVAQQSCSMSQCNAECELDSDCNDGVYGVCSDCYCIYSQTCGDGNVDADQGEVCEPPNEESLYCNQSQYECWNNKLGTRDQYGRCNSDCMSCIEDEFVYSCVSGQCGAVCGDDEDCDDGDPNTVDSCLGDCNCQNIPINPECDSNDFNYSGKLFEIQKNGEELMKMDSNGMILIKGNISTGGIYSYQEPAQVFKTGTESLMVIDANGDLYLKGALDENNNNYDMLNIHNSHINNDKLRFDPNFMGLLIDNGNFYIKGCVAENSL